MASLAVQPEQTSLQTILKLPDRTATQIDSKVRELLTNGYVNVDPQGDPGLTTMTEAEFEALGWDGSMATFKKLATKPRSKQGKADGLQKMRRVLEALIEEAKAQQVAEQDAQIDNYMGSVPADAFGNANLGPAVTMNGDQAVFADFSLGEPSLPPPSKSLTVAQIRAGLAFLEVEIPKNVTRKAELLKLYEKKYPESPQFSPQSPPMMGMDGSSSSGMSKEGVGSSSKSSDSSSSGINLSANVPAIEINSQPTSTEITREYANIGRAILKAIDLPAPTFILPVNK